MEDLFNRRRITAYNAGVVWRSAIFPFNRWSIFFFLCARLGFFGLLLGFWLCAPWKKERWKRVLGYLEGLWAFIYEEIARVDVIPNGEVVREK